MSAIAIAQTIVGRFMLLIHSAAVVTCSTMILKENLYALFAFTCFLQIGETLYIIFKRSGREYTWISLSTVCYLLSVVPPLLAVEVKMLRDFQTNVTISANSSVIAGLREIGVTIDISFSDKLLIEIVKQTLLIIIMIHRWVIPRGALSRNSLSHLLFVFFALSSDIMELFELFENKQVRKRPIVPYAILAAWTLSLVQLCMVLTNTRLARRNRITQIDDQPKETGDMNSEEVAATYCCHSAMATDVWSILLTLGTMDIPFLVIRLYIIIHIKIITYGTIFFTVKNILIIILSMYRFVIICCSKKPHG